MNPPIIKKKIIHNGIALASSEELDFMKWTEEAAEFIIESVYQPEPFVLTESVNIPVNEKKTRCLFRPHTYGADWMIRFNEKFYQYFPNVFLFSSAGHKTYLDIKGGFSRSRLESDNTFRLNQKWVYNKYGVYVHKVILKNYKQGKTDKPGFFNQTFVPSSALYCSNRKILTAKKGYSDCKLLREVVK